MKLIIIILGMLSFIACNPDAVRNKVPFYVVNDVPCNEEWNNAVCFDTLLLNNIQFKMTSFCQSKIDYIDTTETNADTFSINKMHNLEFRIRCSLFNNELVITKNNFKDSLASDLIKDGFLTPPYDFVFDEKDSSFVFKTFIGHADTDAGDIYVLKVNKNASTQVIAVEDLEMGK
jgi:hypothetical protein